MGVLKFQLTSPTLAERVPELRKAYITGLDRTPSRLALEFRPGLMICHRDTNESGRLFTPWPVEGFGTPIVGTATLAERAEPYNLAVELARGKLNDVRNQLADWRQMGLRPPAALDNVLAEAHHAFIKAATSSDDPEGSFAAAQASLSAIWRAGEMLVDTYTAQVLQTRLSSTTRLPTLLGCALEGDPKHAPWGADFSATFNAARISCPWKTLAPTEGQYRWDELDAQLAWCRRQRLAIQAGPLLDFRPGALPDWLWLWEGDFDTILGLVVDLVRQTVTRYRGKVPTWNLVHRPACNEILGLSEEEQIRLTARAVQIARQADPAAQILIGVERPWAEWMGSSPFQLGPLHLADYLVRADLGLAGLGLEIAPGYSAPGSYIRDLFDFSKLLDLYALLNLPLHIGLALPSATGPDTKADPSVKVEAGQWPAPPDEVTQSALAAQWVALAVAKPFVRSVTWLQPTDAAPHLFPHAGLYRADQSAKPIVGWLKSFRRELLA
jgi:hypothetical protein